MFAQTRSLSLVAALAAISLAGIAGKAEAAPQCGDHDKIVDVLGNKFKENRRVMGVVNSKAVMEIFMSPQGTWTMVITDTSGISCITAAGEEWQDVPVAVAGLGELIPLWVSAPVDKREWKLTPHLSTFYGRLRMLLNTGKQGTGGGGVLTQPFRGLPKRSKLSPFLKPFSAFLFLTVPYVSG